MNFMGTFCSIMIYGTIFKWFTHCLKHKLQISIYLNLKYNELENYYTLTIKCKPEYELPVVNKLDKWLICYNISLLPSYFLTTHSERNAEQKKVTKIQKYIYILSIFKNIFLY